MRKALLIAAALVPLWAAGNADLGQVQAVYLLPMSNGFEQYLANQLTLEGVFQVVTDPARADCVFTDQIGATFESKLTELYPPPKEPAKEGDADADIFEQTPLPRSSFGRGKGNIFLVDVKTRRVIWSDYELPKSLTSKDLKKSSEHIVERLQKAIQGK